MLSRYQLLSPWPERALAFTTAIERVAHLIGRARSAMGAHFQLTVPGWRMLRHVKRSGSGATLTYLARRLQVTRPSAAETASRLCASGYLSIDRSSGDRRLRLLTVTGAGMECLSELDAAIEFLLLEMTNDISPASLEASARILNGMARRLRACDAVYRRPGRPTG